VTDPAASSSAIRCHLAVVAVGRLPQLLLLLGEVEAEPCHPGSPIGLMTSSPNRASAVSVAS